MCSTGFSLQDERMCVPVCALVCVGRLLAWNGTDRKCVTDDQTEAKVEIREIPAARKATQAKKKKNLTPEDHWRTQTYTDTQFTTQTTQHSGKHTYTLLGKEESLQIFMSVVAAQKKKTKKKVASH